jgi:hypothetical protein
LGTLKLCARIKISALLTAMELKCATWAGAFRVKPRLQHGAAI